MDINLEGKNKTTCLPVDDYAYRADDNIQLVFHRIKEEELVKKHNSKTKQSKLRH